ncbi:hypothetical protein TNCV_822501 [Trichonephila clavipes]|nr:hypothetical protein TNCV_822501 [Trichonephila clavipes]
MEPAVFTCISMLGRAVGHTIMQDIKELLEPMMATGLSPALTASLRELACQIPQLKKDIQEGLLKMLSVVLMRRHLRHPGMPKHLTNQAPSSALHQSLLEVNDVASITLALKTLGSFDFQGRPLMLFVRYCAENYLSSEVKEIRLEAVRTCCKLLSPAIQIAAICDISRSCLDPNGFAVLNCIVKIHTSLSPPSLRLRLCSRFTLLST